MVLVLLGVIGSPPLAAADRLILRNLKIIADTEVASLDEDGIRLKDQRLIGWDEIERGTVMGKQAEFDRLKTEIGEPLFRVRSRLKVGDYVGAAEPAETLYPRFAGRRSPSAALVHLATVWSRLAKGERERAVAPHLYFLEAARSKGMDGVSFPGERAPKFDRATGMSDDLPAVWFDAAAAKQALPDVLKAVAAMSEPRPEGARIYYATLAFAAGDSDAALKALRGVSGSTPRTNELRDIALAQQEIQSGQLGPAHTKLVAQQPQLLADNQALARYWLGRASLLAKDEATVRAGVLQLLHIPALDGARYPDLAAAAIHDAMLALENLRDTKGAISLRKELLQNFGQTYHARKLRTQP